MEGRKLEEATFHDTIRDRALAESDPSQYAYLTSNLKFYAVARASTNHYLGWLQQRVGGKRVLDYGCGGGGLSFWLAEHGAREVVGIDIIKWQAWMIWFVLSHPVNSV